MLASPNSDTEAFDAALLTRTLLDHFECVTLSSYVAGQQEFTSAWT